MLRMFTTRVQVGLQHAAARLHMHSKHRRRSAHMHSKHKRRSARMHIHMHVTADRCSGSKDLELRLPVDHSRL